MFWAKVNDMHERAPSPYQVGLAHFMHQRVKRTSLLKRTACEVHVLRPGAGKSRVEIALLMLLSKLVGNDAKVHMVYSNKLLRRRDQQLFGSFWPANVVVHHSLDFKPAKNDIIVMDEGESQIYTSPTDFRKLVRQARFTMVLSPNEADSTTGVEARVLKELGVRIYKHDLGAEVEPSFEPINWAGMSPQEKFSFVQSQQSKQPALFYCNAADRDFLCAQSTLNIYELTADNVDFEMLEK